MDGLLRETIELDSAEENELLFKVQVEGAEGPASIRLVCESDGLSFMFPGHSTDQEDVIQFIVPKMSKFINENITLSSRVEVLVENKYFIPVEFDIDIKKVINVVAESLIKKVVRAVKPKEIKVAVSASPIIQKRRITKETKMPKGKSLHEIWLAKNKK